jgi:glutathione S-transferase
MVNLYQLTGYWGIPSPSPFCMKLETYLRMAGIHFTSINILDALVAPANRKAPKKKIPFIEYNGKLIGDSSLIMDFLKKEFTVNVDSHLTPEEFAQGLAIQRMFEDHFFYTIVYSRWLDKLGWEVTCPEFFKGLRYGLYYIIPLYRRHQMRKSLYRQGIGRHTEEEIYHMGKQDLDAFSYILGDKPFIFGDKPSSFDAMAHGFLVNTMRVPFEISIKKFALAHQNLVDYVNRIDKLYYSL